MSSPKCQVSNEWSTLKKVIVGTAVSWGADPTAELAVDPKSREHILAGTYPTENDVQRELEGLVTLLKSNDVEVIRPVNIEGLNQVFSRDVGIVINDKLIHTSMIAGRSQEWEGIENHFSHLSSNQILIPTVGVRIEGGDVMPMGDEIWVGFGEGDDFEKYRTSRTNELAIEWLISEFPNHHIRSFALSKSDIDPRLNALHLDCCLSVLSGGHAIFHPGGMKYEKDRHWIRKHFEGKIIELDAEGMYDMHCNLFSITPATVISGQGFNKVNTQLRNWGYEVLETPMGETSKMGGLLRCVTLPIIRS